MNFINNFDSQAMLWVQDNIRMPLLSGIFVPLTRLGNAGVLFIAVALILLCFKKTRTSGVLMLISMAVCYIFNDLIIKRIIERPRPFNSVVGLVPLVSPPKSFSFPSGHTASAFAAMVSLFFTKRKFAFAGLVVAFLMGCSRVYVGVHYPTDVIVGALVGALTAGMVGMLYKNRLRVYKSE